MSLARREAVVAVARHHGVPILEDDAYGPLPVSPPSPLAALAPELTYYVGGLAKTLSPALRLAYLAVPDTRSAIRVAGAIRATAAMASPLTAAIATRWIDDGTADAVLASHPQGDGSAASHRRQDSAAGCSDPGFRRPITPGSRSPSPGRAASSRRACDRSESGSW
ncbi:MAG: hypothetical protein WDN49_26255 [Acetobacteraceae bacterium]